MTDDKVLYDSCKGNFRFNQPLSSLIAQNSYHSRFLGTQFVEITSRDGSITPIFSRDSFSQREKGKITLNLCRLLGIKAEVVTYGSYKVRNPLKYTKFNADNFEQDVLSQATSNKLNELEERIGLGDFKFPSQVNFSLDPYVQAGEQLNSELDSLSRIISRKKTIESGTYSDFCPCCYDSEYSVSIPLLQSYDKDFEIGGFSRITYLADGVSKDASLRKRSAKIYETHLTTPLKKQIPKSISVLEKNLDDIHSKMLLSKNSI